MNFFFSNTDYVCMFVSLCCILGCSEVLERREVLSDPAGLVCEAGPRQCQAPSTVEIVPSWELYTMPCELRIFPVWPGRTGPILSFVWVPAIVLPNPFEASTPKPRVLLSHTCTINTMLSLRGDILHLWSSVSVRLSPLRRSVLWFLSASVSLVTQLCLLNLRKSTCSSLWGGNSEDSDMNHWVWFISQVCDMSGSVVPQWNLHGYTPRATSGRK